MKQFLSIQVSSRAFVQVDDTVTLSHEALSSPPVVFPKRRIEKGAFALHWGIDNELYRIDQLA